MTAEMEIALKKSLDLMSELLKKEEKDELPGHGLEFRPDLTLETIYVFPQRYMDSDPAKEMFALTLLGQCVERPTHIFVCTMDVLAVEYPDHLRTPEEVAQWREEHCPENFKDLPPELRREFIVFSVNQMGQRGENFAYPYKKVNGEVIFGAEIFHGTLLSRFCYDLSFGDYDAAAKKIIEGNYLEEDVKQ